MTKIFTRMAVTLVCVAMCTGGAQAQVPGQIHYQGRLILNGSAVSDTVDLTFRIYDDAKDGNLLFEETQSVTIVDGFYSAYIGASGELNGSLFHEIPMTYLELEVGGETLSPRERLVTVAYAFKAQYAEEAAVAHRLIDAPVAEAVVAPEPEPLHINSTTNVSFFAHRDGLDQNIGTNGEKLVIWRAEDFDTANSMDLNNNRFVVPVNGFYRLTAQVFFDPPPAPKTDPAYLAKLVLRQNSTNVLSSFVTRFRKGASQSLATSRDVQLTSGDVVEVYLGHSHKGAGILKGQSYHTYFSGYLLHQ